MQIQFVVDHEPVPQPRPRASGRGGFITVYEAERGHPIFSFKEAVSRAASKAMGKRKLLEGPLRATFVFVFPRPSTMLWKKKLMEREWHAKKKDCDNCCKSALDAMEGIVYGNDGQIADLWAQKYIASGDEEAHVEITVEKISD